MSDITLTTADGVEYAARTGDLSIPYRGCWTAYLILADALAPPTGAVTLTWHGLPFAGHVVRAGESEGQTSCFISGGRGGLWKALQAKHYDAGVAASLVLSEALQGAGETLSPASAQQALSANLATFPRRAVELGAVLDELAAAAGAVWRVVDDGAVWFGVDAWGAADYEIDRAYTSLHFDPVTRCERVAPLQPFAPRPGQTWAHGRVARVHLQDDGGTYCARVWYLDESGAGADDPVAAALRGLIAEELQAHAHHPTFGGQVLVQRGDGRLDVLLDASAFPPLTNVPYLAPPGVALVFGNGTRIALAFLGGDSRFPVVMHAESGSGSRPVAGQGDTVNVGALVFSTVAPGVLTGTYTDPDGVTSPITLGATIQLKGKISSGFGGLKIP